MSIQFKQTTLPNGLQIIAEVEPEAHSAALGFFVKTGARDEDPAVMGVSHFLEHMMFKGTEKRTAAEVDRGFDDIGADHNAFTTSEMTAFWAHALPDHLRDVQEILADILRPSIRPDDFDAEKKVILEEIAMYQDNPFWVLYEKAMEAYYGSHPLGHRVLGTEQTVGDMNREAMLAYFNERYSADNTVVAMAGRVDFDAVVERLTEHCGGWATTEAEREHRTPDYGGEDVTLTRDTVHRHYVLMLSPAPAAGDERRYAASMLCQILGDVEGSRLYWALIETGLADEAQVHFDGRDGIGDYLVYSSCTPANAERVERVIGEQIEGLVDSLTEDDLERTRNKVATSATLHGELPAGRMQRLGRVWTYTAEYRPLEQELERIGAVTLDELREVHAAFPMKSVLTGRLAPGG